jgi:alpha-ketoglutaric semialdehyde dehydrogenase
MTTMPAHPSLMPVLAGRRGEAFANFVDGAWLSAASGRTFERRNPADTRELIGTFPVSDGGDVALAVNAAAAAFPAWRDTPLPRRGAILAAAAVVMTRRAEELAQALTWEEGKTLAESRQEVGRAIAYLEFMAGEGRRLGAETLPSESGGLNYTARKPLGVVAAITPWNFPVNIPTIKSAPAMLAGNTVVLKPSELAPLTGVLLAEIYAEAGVPAGVFNVVHGAAEAGQALVAHPMVKAVTFTGSTEVGRDINQRAAARFAKTQLEMGGKNASIILGDADLDRAASDVALGGFSVTGQRCNANSLVLVQKSVFEAFTNRLVAKAQAYRVGPGLDPDVTMGPLVEASAQERLDRYMAEARKDGASVLTGGHMLKDGEHAHGFYMAPTVIAGVKPEHAVCCEELFGPVVALVPIDSLEEGLAIANRLPYGLASSVYTQHLAAAMQYVERIETGLAHVNCATTLSELQMPYGGMKESGHGGREMGTYVLDFYTEIQAVYIRP